MTGCYGWKDAAAPGSVGVLSDAIVRNIKKLKPARILDVGSGNGAVAALLTELGHEVVGMEIDRDGCEIAQRAYPGITFLNLGVETDPAELLRLGGGPFDLVISTEVIEHLYSPHLIPQLARAVLRPGGHLLLTTPYHGYLKNLALSVANGWDSHFSSLWHGGHIKFFSFNTIEKLLNDNGFEVETRAGAGRLPWLWMSMIILARPSATGGEAQ